MQSGIRGAKYLLPQHHVNPQAGKCQGYCLLRLPLRPQFGPAAVLDIEQVNVSQMSKLRVLSRYIWTNTEEKRW